MTVKQLKEKLDDLPYECYLIVYGPARDYRTKYRSEHCGVFDSGIVTNKEEAFKMIENLKYPGYYSEMNIIAIYTYDDGELIERIIL